MDGLGTEVSNLPPVGSKGRVIGDVYNWMQIPYVYISFDEGSKNGSLYWAIPCSCLKRVKYIKVKSVYQDVPQCFDDKGNYCVYFDKNCSSLGLFPACSEEEIIYLKVKNAP